MFFFITMIIAGAGTIFPLRKKRDFFLGLAAMAICAFIEFLWYYIFREAFLAEPYTVIWENIHEIVYLGFILNYYIRRRRSIHSCCGSCRICARSAKDSL